MGGMALVVLGLFVLVWIISAVVKASQDTGPKRPAPRPRPTDAPRGERTSNSDIDRFMAEIDRLRRKGEGHPAGRPAEQSRPGGPKPVVERGSRLEQRPKPLEPRRERDRRPRATGGRSVPAPPPLPRGEPVPVLRPVTPEPPTPPPAAPPKPARPARPAPVTAPVAVSPVAKTVQDLLRSKEGPAAALILSEIFGEPRARRPIRPPG